MLGHVEDLGERERANGEGRLYQTHKAQPYHADDCDIFVLLCLQRALEGEDSHVVPTCTIYNMLQRKQQLDVLD
jgi:hypothetical protein